MYFNEAINTDRIKLCIGSSLFPEHLTWLQSERGRSGKKVKSKTGILGARFKNDVFNYQGPLIIWGVTI